MPYIFDDDEPTDAPPAPSPDTQRDMRDFWRDHAEWSQATFGTDSKRGPIGPLRHLLKEVGEAIEAWSEEDGNALCEEITDCLLLILDSARRAGMSYDEVIRSAYAKLAINKARSWPQANSDQPVEHARLTAPPTIRKAEPSNYSDEFEDRLTAPATEDLRTAADILGAAIKDPQRWLNGELWLSHSEVMTLESAIAYARKRGGR